MLVCGGVCVRLFGRIPSVVSRSLLHVASSPVCAGVVFPCGPSFCACKLHALSDPSLSWLDFGGARGLALGVLGLVWRRGSGTGRGGRGPGVLRGCIVCSMYLCFLFRRFLTVIHF